MYMGGGVVVERKGKGKEEAFPWGFAYVSSVFLPMYMGIFVGWTPVACPVGRRVSGPCEYLRNPGMEFPIAVVAREIAAPW